MMTRYLDPETDPHDLVFKDKKKVELLKGTVHCHVCHGYGRWNLILDAYGVGNHFVAVCSQCNGDGYLDPFGPHVNCSRHYWIPIIKISQHVYIHKCLECNYEKEVDSS